MEEELHESHAQASCDFDEDDLASTLEYDDTVGTRSGDLGDVGAKFSKARASSAYSGGDDGPDSDGEDVFFSPQGGDDEENSIRDGDNAESTHENDNENDNENGIESGHENASENRYGTDYHSVRGTGGSAGNSDFDNNSERGRDDYQDDELFDENSFEDDGSIDEAGDFSTSKQNLTRHSKRKHVRLSSGSNAKRSKTELTHEERIARATDQANMLTGSSGPQMNDSNKKRKKKKMNSKKGRLSKAEMAQLEKMDQVQDEDDVDAFPPISEEERQNGIELGGDVRLHRIFSKVVKPHQAVGVKFLWKHVGEHKGCVLADYMGLGKTLQTISLIHTFLVNYHDILAPSRPTTVLVVAPSSVLHNWRREMFKWMDPKTSEGAEALKLINVKVMDSSSASSASARTTLLKTWIKEGGVMIIGYELYRSLTQSITPGAEKSKASSSASSRHTARLLTSEPGPSLVVVDEGHRLRHSKSQIVKAMSLIRSRARVVLTGYPLQNHLEEYWCMVNFARPNALGSAEQFKHRFKVPIENGQAADADENDAVLARMRTFILFEKLKPIILRRDSQHLAKELPPKYEWVLRCRLTDLQRQLYRAFVRDKCRDAEKDSSSQNGGIIAAYHYALAIVNHPDILYSNMLRAQKNEALNDVVNESDGIDTGASKASKLSVLQRDEYRYKKFKETDPVAAQQADEWFEELDIEVPVEFGNVLGVGSGKVRRTPESEEKEDILFVTFSLEDRIHVGAEILQVDDQETNGSLAQFQHCIALAQQAGELSITVKVRNIDLRSWLFTEIRRADHLRRTALGRVPESTLAKSHEQRDAQNSKLADQPDDELVEVCAVVKESSHALGWAEPLMKDYTPQARLCVSGKMRVLFSLLRYIRNENDKAIVFSQSVTTLNIIEKIIKHHNANVASMDSQDIEDDSNAENFREGSDKVPYLDGVTLGYKRLDGSTPQVDRNKIVNDFNNARIQDYAVFLASTRAAGEGLNLQSANRVIMFDTCWNPCLDHEAMCRSYRFGQQKPVSVYRLVGAGTMERTIFDQQTKKEGLTSRVVDARATKRTVEAADLRNFFNLKRFNRVQKDSVQLPDLKDDKGQVEESAAKYVGKEEDESPEMYMQKVKALRVDMPLQNLLRFHSNEVAKYRLEDLLMNEDESERASPEARQAALEEFNEFEEEEHKLIEAGCAPAAAAATAWRIVRERRRQAQNGAMLGEAAYAELEVPLGGARNSSGRPYPAPSFPGQNMPPAYPHNSAYPAPFEVLPSHGVLAQHYVEELDMRRILLHKSVLVLPRRMPNFDEVKKNLLQMGASVFLEVHHSISYDYIVSAWNLTQLESWRARQESKGQERNEVMKLAGAKFKSHLWPRQCLLERKIAEGCDSTQLDINMVDDVVVVQSKPSSTSPSPHVHEVVEL